MREYINLTLTRTIIESGRHQAACMVLPIMHMHKSLCTRSHGGMAVRLAWDEVVDEVCHGEEGAGRVKEVHIQESDERQPQVTIGEVAEAVAHITAAC